MAETLDQFCRVNRAVVGLHACRPTSSTVCYDVTECERETCTASEACDEADDHIFDRDGQVIPNELGARMISMSAVQLRGVPELIGLFGGVVRSEEALRAVLKSGIRTGVVTGVTTARRLLRYTGPDKAPRTKDRSTE